MRRSLPHGWSLLLISLAVITTIAVLFGTVLGLFQAQSYDDSMQPTIHTGDWLIGLNASIAGSIHRNEVWQVNWGGLVGSVRVVGLPRDRVQIRNGVLVLNGKRLREPYCIPYSAALGDFPLPSKAYSDELLRVYHDGAYGDKLDRLTEYVVPHDSYFVLNDNRKQLSDSRTMGPVPRDQFVARLMVAYGASGSVFKLGRIL
jgi:signal peptidase I